MAVVAFLSGSAHGWGRRELAEWLVCHYGACVRRIDDEAHAEPGPRVVIALPDSRRWMEERRTAVDEANVNQLVRNARHDVMRILYDLGDPDRAQGITRLVIARGLVRATVDGGGRAWVPLDRPRLGLVDRIVSLLVADYLNAPLDYRDVVGQRDEPRRCESGVHEIEFEAAPPTLRSGSMTG